MNAATTSSDQSAIPAASRQRSARRRSMSSSSRSMREGRVGHGERRVENDRSDGIAAGPLIADSAVTWRGFRFRMAAASTSALPACLRARAPRLRSRRSLERGYTACEIDFEGGFWMDYDFAARFGELAREHGHRAVGARADRRLHGPCRARQEAEHGGRDARPLGRDREGAAAPRSSSSTPASCSGARARRRSTRSASSSASCASGSRRRTAPCRSGSR